MEGGHHTTAAVLVASQAEPFFPSPADQSANGLTHVKGLIKGLLEVPAERPAAAHNRVVCPVVIIIQ